MRLEQNYWVHHLDPFLIHFPEGFFLTGIRWYGLAYVAGFVMVLCMLRIYRRADKTTLDSDQQISLVTTLILGTLLGGRLGYMLLYRFADFIKDPLIFFQVWQGGMASHGGIIGIVLACYWFARKHDLAFSHIVDLIATVSPFGIFFGRIANFINAELWGKTTKVAWAVIFPIRNASGIIVDYTVPRHPSQLYEALLEGMILLCYLQARFWLSNASKHYPGQICGEFFIVYPILRIIGETFRAPDAPLIMGLSRGTFYSMVMLFFGIAMICYVRSNRGSQSQQPR